MYVVMYVAMYVAIFYYINLKLCIPLFSNLVISGGAPDGSTTREGGRAGGGGTTGDFKEADNLIRGVIDL